MLASVVSEVTSDQFMQMANECKQPWQVLKEMIFTLCNLLEECANDPHHGNTGNSATWEQS